MVTLHMCVMTDPSPSRADVQVLNTQNLSLITATAWGTNLQILCAPYTVRKTTGYILWQKIPISAFNVCNCFNYMAHKWQH